MAKITPVAWMTAAGVASAVAAIAVFGVAHAREIIGGLLGPMAATTLSWTLIERTSRQRPDRVTALMLAAFAAKLVFFGAYVALALRVLRLAPVPFVASFTSYFIGLYLAEALCLQRLFADAMRAPVPPRAPEVDGLSRAERGRRVERR